MGCKKLNIQDYFQLVKNSHIKYREARFITYDADGNLLNDGKYTYIWNAENRLISITPLTPVANAQKLEFQYDYIGRRTSKKVYNWDTNTSSHSGVRLL